MNFEEMFAHLKAGAKIKAVKRNHYHLYRLGSHTPFDLVRMTVDSDGKSAQMIIWAPYEDPDAEANYIDLNHHLLQDFLENK